MAGCRSPTDTHNTMADQLRRRHNVNLKRLLLILSAAAGLYMIVGGNLPQMTALVTTAEAAEDWSGSLKNPVVVPCQPPAPNPKGTAYQVTWVDNCSTPNTFYYPRFRTDFWNTDGTVSFKEWGPYALRRVADATNGWQVVGSNESIMFTPGGTGYIYGGPMLGGYNQKWIPWLDPPHTANVYCAIINPTGPELLDAGLVTKFVPPPVVVTAPPCCNPTPCCNPPVATPAPAPQPTTYPAVGEGWCPVSQEDARVHLDGGEARFWTDIGLDANGVRMWKFDAGTNNPKRLHVPRLSDGRTWGYYDTWKYGEGVRFDFTLESATFKCAA